MRWLPRLFAGINAALRLQVRHGCARSTPLQARGASTRTPACVRLAAQRGGAALHLSHTTTAQDRGTRLTHAHTACLSPPRALLRHFIHTERPTALLPWRAFCQQPHLPRCAPPACLAFAFWVRGCVPTPVPRSADAHLTRARRAVFRALRQALRLPPTGIAVPRASTTTPSCTDQHARLSYRARFLYLSSKTSACHFGKFWARGILLIRQRRAAACVHQLPCLQTEPGRGRGASGQDRKTAFARRFRHRHAARCCRSLFWWRVPLFSLPTTENGEHRAHAALNFAALRANFPGCRQNMPALTSILYLPLNAICHDLPLPRWCSGGLRYYIPVLRSLSHHRLSLRASLGIRAGIAMAIVRARHSRDDHLFCLSAPLHTYTSGTTWRRTSRSL